jgi:dolichol-phosphate mannosyltransferase
MTARGMNVVLILPTYNERDTILVLLEQAEKALSSFSKHTFSFLVVDDSSPDGTGEAVKEYAKTHKYVHVLSGRKEGLGKALSRGMDYSIETLHADFLIQMDADLSHDPNVLPKFVEALDKGYDFVVGSRYIKGGSIPDNWGIKRKIYSVMGNSFVRFGLGYSQVHDWTGGYRALKSEYFIKNKERLSKYTGYVFQIAFLHQSILQGASVYEVPIHFTDRRFGKSKIAVGEYIQHIIEYVFSERIKRLRKGPFKKFAAVGVLGFIINTIVLEICVHMIGLSPTKGSLIGAEIAIISNFYFNNRWTFKERKIEKGNVFRKFLQFNITSAGAMLIQAGTVFVGTLLFGHSYYRIFYLLGVSLGLMWNYIMYSRVIWR